MLQGEHRLQRNFLWSGDPSMRQGKALRCLQEPEEASLHSRALLSLKFLQCPVGPLPLQPRQRLLSEVSALLPGQTVSWDSIFCLKHACEMISADIQLAPSTFYLGAHMKLLAQTQFMGHFARPEGAPGSDCL